LNVLRADCSKAVPAVRHSRLRISCFNDIYFDVLTSCTLQSRQKRNRIMEATSATSAVELYRYTGPYRQ